MTSKTSKLPAQLQLEGHCSLLRFVDILQLQRFDRPSKLHYKIATDTKNASS